VANCLLAGSGQHPTGPSTIGLSDTILTFCDEAFAQHRDGRLAEAIAWYQRILALSPALHLIRNNLGHALAQQGEIDAAMVEYRRAVEIKSDYPDALCNWGAAHYALDQLDEAEAKCRRAIAISSNFAGAHHNLALILKEKGRLDEAIHAEKRAIRLAPRNTSYYEHLGVLRPFTAGDRYIRALEDMAADGASLGATERVHLHFALAKAYDDTGRFENAFVQLSAGNRLKRQQTAYDEAATLGRMDRTRDLFTPDFMKARQGSGDPSPLPVFIVGMPRSGTTLIEQILASHPEVFGAGELNLFDRSAGAVGHALPGAPRFPAMAAGMSAAHFHALGKSYRDALAQRAPAASRIVDKMPGNFLFAGLIHLALPNATIIHAVRDPIDTCVSCFSTLFTNQAQTYDLAELGRYYRHYQTLMTHWRRVLPPGRIIDVCYEDLVGDLEGGARRIIAHCGLPWDRRCLDFHRTERTVRTASAAQVRRPIYKSSVGRWRKYEKFLGPLLDELECTDAHPANTPHCNLKEDIHA
jgi:cytochrome c-type biogenesis protein CcmH/NrfG